MNGPFDANYIADITAIMIIIPRIILRNIIDSGAKSML